MKRFAFLVAAALCLATSASAATVSILGPTEVLLGSNHDYTITWADMTPSNLPGASSTGGSATVSYGGVTIQSFTPTATGGSTTVNLSFGALGTSNLQFDSSMDFSRSVVGVVGQQLTGALCGIIPALCVLQPIMGEILQFGTDTSTAALAITVSEVPPAPVPLPASGLMVLAGLAGFGALRLRRKG